LVVDALKVTEAPEHEVVLAVVMAMVGVTDGEPVTEIVLELTGVEFAQAALLITSHLTCMMLVGLVEVNVELFVPALTPPTFH